MLVSSASSSQSTADDDIDAMTSPLPFRGGVQYFLAAVLLGVVAAWYVKQMNLKRTGLHKKHDDRHRFTSSSSNSSSTHTRMYREIV